MLEEKIKSDKPNTQTCQRSEYWLFCPLHALNRPHCTPEYVVHYYKYQNFGRNLPITNITFCRELKISPCAAIGMTIFLTLSCGLVFDTDNLYYSLLADSAPGINFFSFELFFFFEFKDTVAIIIRLLFRIIHYAMCRSHTYRIYE